MTLTVSTFYKFVEIADPADFRRGVLEQCLSQRLLGSILLAHEGINGTLSGEAENLCAFLSWLRSDPRFEDLESKESPSANHPFGRMKVKLKREIVALGAPEANPARSVGIYIAPQDWNALIDDPEIALVDARNAYEVRIGTFKGAIDPKTRAFRDFPAFVREKLDPVRQPRVAMFCTGGIRCEKASSFLLSQGFKEVYHLQGGILKYLETVPEEQSLWQGECFVFDERVALGHGFSSGSHGLCARCGSPVPLKEAKSNSAGVICENCRPMQIPSF